MPWIVELIKIPKINDFRSNFFPRKYHYKKDAQELIKEIKEKGGEAIIIKGKK